MSNKAIINSALPPTLVALTTCARPHLVATNLAKLTNCLQGLENIDLVVAIDGMSLAANQQTLALAQAMGVDCIVSQAPEGVGISKNRVFKLLDHYAHYFFIEDDVEVLSSELFYGHIDANRQTGIEHFSLHEPERLHTEIEPSYLDNGDIIRHAMFGSAQVNYFTGNALLRAGGWHRRFGQIRRGGHTEHSYRVYYEGLCPAPFNYLEKLNCCCRWHNPASIVRAEGCKVEANRLLDVENRLMAERPKPQPWFAQYPGRLLRAVERHQPLAMITEDNHDSHRYI